MPPLDYDFPGDAKSRELDSMTLEDYFCRTYGVSKETVRLMDAYEAAGGFGLGPDALSAYLLYEWSKIIPTVDDSMATGIQMFPGRKLRPDAAHGENHDSECDRRTAHDGSGLEESRELRRAR